VSAEARPDGSAADAPGTPDAGAPRPRTGRELAARLAAERAALPFLLLRDADDVLRIRPLEPSEPRLTLGRDQANDIALEWDGEISRAHAELEQVAGQWTVSDDGLSRNGTFVNGHPVHGRRRLRDGDCLRLGRTLLTFCAPVGPLSGATLPAQHAPALDDLTPTQRRVLGALCRPLVAAGGVVAPASNQEIADAVHLSVEGVKGQLRTLSARFGVADLPQNRKRLELAERAWRAGMGAPAG
jgi:pSer/pThr/pTyr-binding forkhead associated (FHA) protein